MPSGRPGGRSQRASTCARWHMRRCGEALRQAERSACFAVAKRALRRMNRFGKGGHHRLPFRVERCTSQTAERAEV